MKKLNLFLLILLIVSLVSGILYSNKLNQTVSSNSGGSNHTSTVTNNEPSTPTVTKTFSPATATETTSDNINIPVLYYHSINSTVSNEVILSPDTLRQQLQYVKDSGYTTITMSQFNDYIKGKGKLPKKSILITFDDGYMDNYANAYPILKELNMTATIFVISSGIDDGYYLSSAQIKEMSDYGIDIESHTVNHVHLNTLSYQAQVDELTKSKTKLESITGKPVTAIAYPFGDYTADTKKATKESGYSLGFTTDTGFDNKQSDSFTLKRLYISSAFTFDKFKTRLQSGK